MKKRNDIVFHSQEELYERIVPALRSKKKLLITNGFKYINEADIWDYMRNEKWRVSNGLELCDMVNDILNTDNKLLVTYYHNKYMPRPTISEDGIDLPKLKSWKAFKLKKKIGE